MTDPSPNISQVEVASRAVDLVFGAGPRVTDRVEMVLMRSVQEPLTETLFDELTIHLDSVVGEEEFDPVAFLTVLDGSLDIFYELDLGDHYDRVQDWRMRFGSSIDRIFSANVYGLKDWRRGSVSALYRANAIQSELHVEYSIIRKDGLEFTLEMNPISASTLALNLVRGLGRLPDAVKSEFDSRAVEELLSAVASLVVDEEASHAGDGSTRA